MIAGFIARLMPYRWLILAALLFGAGWQINGWRMGRQIAEIERDAANAKAAAVNESRAKEQYYVSKLQEAQSALTKSQETIRTLSAANVAISNGLRDTANSIKSRLPSLTADALRDVARTYGDIFTECQTRRGELAETAERLNAEKRALIEAWPK